MTGKEFHSLYPMKMIKNIRKDLTHNGFVFQDGLNVLQEKFDPNKLGKGGFHFIKDNSNYLLHLGYGECIVDVDVPEDATIVCINDVFKTNKIILKMDTLTFICDSDFSLKDVDMNGLEEDFKKIIQHYQYVTAEQMEFLKPLFQKIFNIIPSLIKYAIDINAMYYTYIEDPSIEITLYALNKNPKLIRFIENPNCEMLKTCLIKIM